MDFHRIKPRYRASAMFHLFSLAWALMAFAQQWHIYPLNFLTATMIYGACLLGRYLGDIRPLNGWIAFALFVVMFVVAHGVIVAPILARDWPVTDENILLMAEIQTGCHIIAVFSFWFALRGFKMKRRLLMSGLPV